MTRELPFAMHDIDAIEAINVEISADTKLDVKAETTLQIKAAAVTITSSGAGKYEGGTMDLN